MTVYSLYSLTVNEQKQGLFLFHGQNTKTHGQICHIQMVRARATNNRVCILTSTLTLTLGMTHLAISYVMTVCSLCSLTVFKNKVRLYFMVTLNDSQSDTQMDRIRALNSSSQDPKSWPQSRILCSWRDPMTCPKNEGRECSKSWTGSRPPSGTPACTPAPP